MSITLEQQKNFWIARINALKAHKGVHQNRLTENEGSNDNLVWTNKLLAKSNWNEVEEYAVGICQDIYAKQTQNNSAFPVLIGGNPDVVDLLNHLQLVLPGSSLYGLLKKVEVVEQVLRDKVGVDISNNNGATDNDGNPILDADGNRITEWENFVNQKTFNGAATLNDIPAEKDLLILIYQNDLYEQIIDDTNGLPDLIERGHNIADVYGHYWHHKVNANRLQQYADNENELDNFVIEIKNILGLGITDILPNDWENQLVKKTDLDTAQATIATLTTERNNYKTKADEYDRIHTKLEGKVSDAELDTLINTPPQCSHTDYDAIKSERDTLKTEQDTLKSENTQLKENQQQLISELGLAENSDFQSVLAKVKELMKSPDSSEKDQQITQLTQTNTQLKQAKSQLETQLTEKETKITELQAQKPTEEVKSQIIESSKQLGLFSSEFQQKLNQAKNYQEVVKIQEEEFSYRLNKEISDKKSANSLNIVLGVIALGSLVILGWVLFKNAGLPEVEKKEK